MLRTIAGIIKAALAAIGRTVSRWCSKTGTWIQEKIIEPVVDPVVDFGVDVIRGAGRVAGPPLGWAYENAVKPAGRGVAAAAPHVVNGIAASLKATAKITGAAAAIPGSLVRGLLGGAGGGGGPYAPESDDDTRTERAVRSAMADMMSPSARRLAGVATPHDVARVVHQYARGSDIERLSLDITALPEPVQQWLVSLNDIELYELAESGIAGCAAEIRREVANTGQPIVFESGRPGTAYEAGVAARIQALKGHRSKHRSVAA